MKPYSMKLKIIIVGMVTFICAIVAATFVWHYIFLCCVGIFDRVNALRIAAESVVYIGFILFFFWIESMIVKQIKNAYKKKAS